MVIPSKNMETVEEFDQHVSELQKKYPKPLAFGIGIRRRTGDKTLDVYFPKINWKVAFGVATLLQDVTKYEASSNGFATLEEKQLEEVFEVCSPFHEELEKHENLYLSDALLLAMDLGDDLNYHSVDLIVYFLFDKDTPVADVEEGYFKLQCLSQLHVKPHGIGLDGIFGKLHNIAWTNKGPILPKDLEGERVNEMMRGRVLSVSHVDKFPYMVDYHIPEGVRIAKGSQVRLGAHCASGTTVMPAGYINFNAGTLGNAMVEGRISAGVVIGENTDLGGGASIMGTLSGGNKHVISIGGSCLLGANSGTGISLGFGCTIAAGVYVTAGAKVHLYDADKQPIDLQGAVVAEGENIVKGAALSGREKLLFLQDTATGHLICRPNPKTIALNDSLHVDN